MSSSTLTAVFVLSMLAFGCGEQEEGERCDTNNGNFDCAPGLQCKSGTQLNIEGQGAVALCCPPDDVIPSVDACRAGATPSPDEDPPASSVDAGDGGS